MSRANLLTSLAYYLDGESSQTDRICPSLVLAGLGVPMSKFILLSLRVISFDPGAKLCYGQRFAISSKFPNIFEI